MLTRKCEGECEDECEVEDECEGKCWMFDLACETGLN